jgi:hypothetical protein
MRTRSDSKYLEDFRDGLLARNRLTGSLHVGITLLVLACAVDTQHKVSRIATEADLRVKQPAGARGSGGGRWARTVGIDQRLPLRNRFGNGCSERNER